MTFKTNNVLLCTTIIAFIFNYIYIRLRYWKGEEVSEGLRKIWKLRNWASLKWLLNEFIVGCDRLEAGIRSYRRCSWEWWLGRRVPSMKLNLLLKAPQHLIPSCSPRRTLDVKHHRWSHIWGDHKTIYLLIYWAGYEAVSIIGRKTFIVSLNFAFF